MVSHGGTSYMCISNVSGTTTPNADTSNWDTMAGKGDTGNTGSQGVTGNTGSQGPIGNTGPSGFPSGGTAGQVVTNTSSGAGTWQDAAGGGKLLQVYNYSDGTRASTSPTETWTTQFSGNFTKLSSTSTIVMATSISSYGEHRSGAHERMQFGSSTSTVKTGSWPHSGAGQQTQTYVITNNTQTGSLAWTFQWHHRPCYIVNPNSSDSGEFTTQTYTNIVFWEVEV
jgi:hypothetical protein